MAATSGKRSRNRFKANLLMKETEALKVFLLPNLMMNTEFISLLGDKYATALPFTWKFVTDIHAADVIVWNGVIAPKFQGFMELLKEELQGNKVLLLMSESTTLQKELKSVSALDLDNIRYVEVAVQTALPESILSALDECYQKLKHV